MIGRPPDWVPATGEEADAAFEQALDLLRAPGTKSGYTMVTAAGKKWQAKITARGKQRILGTASDPRIAASLVLDFLIGSLPPPASPAKPRNRRGEGRRLDSRHGKHRRVERASGSALVTVQQVEVSENPPVDAIVVPCQLNRVVLS